jgi:nucleotide-binding universal stress UspA family protein
LHSIGEVTGKYCASHGQFPIFASIEPCFFMTNPNNLFLIPTDFTAVAECAINHAICVAKTVGGELALLHVIAKDKERAAVQAKLDKIAADITAKHNIPVKTVVKDGNIFDDIGGVAETLGAKLIFMGTHGVKGMQHITGSYAIKVITNSNVPFIVVQERNERDGYKRIVLPMDLSKESKQKLDLTIRMANYFKSKVYIFSQYEDDQFLKNAVDRNAGYARNEMKKHGIAYELVTAKEKKDFVKQLNSYSASVDADLIAIVNSQERGVHELLHGTSEREVITNEAQIPVMCVNPQSISSSRVSSVMF